MSKFDQYFLMKNEDAIDYVKETLDFFPADAELDCKEIGDGNLNYIFKVFDKNTGKSIIVKQAGGEARISSEFKLSQDRNRIESEILQMHYETTGGLVPKIYRFDTVMGACIMEDLSDHTVMRYALMKHEVFPKFAEHISTYLVNTLLGTSDVVVEHKAKKELVKKYINPQLCEISEQLVYTEPYNNNKDRNLVFAPNAEFVKKELYDDTALHLEVAKLKFEFLNNAQSLVHGDLHTGSIFIKEDSTKVFDPEFAFYGPMGYDVGNVIANLIFAWNNAMAVCEDEAKRKAFTNWIEKSVEDVIDLFSAKFVKYFEENVTDDMAPTKGFCQWYLESVLADTAAVTGLELNRRIVGLAQVKDITTIADEQKRVNAERICIRSAKQYIMNRTEFKTGKDFVNVFLNIAKEYMNI